MARAVPVPVRLVLFRRWQRGQPVAHIADALDLPVRTVRHLIRCLRTAPHATLGPAYQRCGRRRPWPNQELVDEALRLRRQHPRWGAGLIHVFLQQRWPKEPLPSPRTLQRWFAHAGLGPAPRGVRPKTSPARARQAHEVWQIDAVEQLPLQPPSTRVSWLRLADEFTGAVLHTKVFPISRFAQVGAAAVQVELRQAFTRWGRPQQIRVDNGPPWGSKGDLPTPLALWLLGLQMQVLWNPPRQPRKNAVVERTQGVSQQWVEAHTCASADELQARLQQMDRLQREQYPSVAESRLEKHPHLAHSGRDYSESWENRHWSLAGVLECLSEYVVPRRVDQNGEVWMYDHGHWVGKPWIGQVVYVTVDAHTQEWVYQDEHGSVIRRQAAKELTAERIRNLQIGRASHG